MCVQLRGRAALDVNNKEFRGDFPGCQKNPTFDGVERQYLCAAFRKKSAVVYHSWHGLKYDAPTAAVQTNRKISISLLIGLGRQGCGLSPHPFDLPIEPLTTVFTGIVITGTSHVGKVPKVMLYADKPPFYMRPKLLMLGHFRSPFHISIQSKLPPSQKSRIQSYQGLVHY